MRGAGIIGILLFAFNLGLSQAESDTIPSGNLSDTLVQNNRPVEKIESYAKQYDPRKAMLYAAVFPGAGQFYNKKYWKIPLVYGGFGAFLYGVNFYQGLNVRFKNDLYNLINDPSSNGGVSPDNLTTDQLRTIVDRTRRERDFLIILTGFFYILQMVDAHVDAHLKEFDLNPKLQLTVEPVMENNYMMGRSTGLTLKLRF
ncbi:MAG: hypothetical protein JNM78_06890 [Cyclobacteriaceae bacterium]|nr:hypothetical protein [Cyclobacteriaceae bacterium]